MGEKRGQSCEDQLGGYCHNVTLRHLQEDSRSRKDIEKERSVDLHSREDPDMMRKPFLLSDHFGSHWLWWPVPGERPSCHFCSGQFIQEQRHMCGEKVPCCAPWQGWARPRPLKDLFIQPRRLHLCAQ